MEEVEDDEEKYEKKTKAMEIEYVDNYIAEPIEKIVNKYISSKKLDIPIFLRTSL